MGACGSTSGGGPGVNHDADTIKTAETFVEGEYVRIWSAARQSWNVGKIAKFFPDAGKDGEHPVGAGTYKVIVSGQKKYVIEGLQKVTICASCRRPAADGYANCCRTCEATRGRAHGPLCDEAYDVMRASGASRVPSKDEAIEHSVEISPGAFRVPSKDEAIEHTVDISPGQLRDHQKATRCNICRRPATLYFGVCCRTCQDTQGQSHGPRCDAASDAAPPAMSLEASQVPRDRAQHALREQAISASTSRSDPHTHEDMTRNERKHEGDYRCTTPGCSRPTWNGKAGEVCCRTCAANEGKHHGRECNQKYEAISASASSLDLHTHEDMTRNERKHEGDYRCTIPGCSRPTWNGKAGEVCCRTCAANEGKHHGRECNQKYEAISASTL